MTIFYGFGVDPGACSGWALVGLVPAGRELLAHGVAKHAPYRAVLEQTTLITGVLEQVSCVVEDQWLPSDAGGKDGHRAHAVDALKTADSAGGWREACAAWGWTVLPKAQPNAWRAAMYRGAWHPSYSRAQCKDLARRYVAGLYHLDLPSARADEAEGIVLATYAAELARHQALTADGTVIQTGRRKRR